MTRYPITSNCNFSGRDDARGMAVAEALAALDAGLTDDADLDAAFESLEETLSESADLDDADSVEGCRKAEDAVCDAWTDSVQEVAADAEIDRYVD